MSHLVRAATAHDRVRRRGRPGHPHRRRAVPSIATRYDAGGRAAPQVKVVVFGVHERAQQQRSLMDTLHWARETDQRCASAEAQVRRLKVHDPPQKSATAPAASTASRQLSAMV